MALLSLRSIPKGTDFVSTPTPKPSKTEPETPHFHTTSSPSYLSFYSSSPSDIRHCYFDSISTYGIHRVLYVSSPEDLFSSLSELDPGLTRRPGFSDQFLSTSSLSSEMSVLILDFTAMTGAEAASLNSLFESPPTLNGTPLKSSLLIYSFVSKQALTKKTFGADFWRRIGRPRQAPKPALPHSFLNLKDRIPYASSDTSCDLFIRSLDAFVDHIVVSPKTPSIFIDGSILMDVLLGGTTFSSTGPRYYPGLLKQLTGFSAFSFNLFIYKAPFESLAVCQFLDSLIETQSFYSKGTVYKLSNISFFRITDIPKSYKDFTRTFLFPSSTAPDTASPFILNQHNFSSFFSGYSIHPDGYVLPHSPFLKLQETGGSLCITSPLSSTQFDQLFFELATHHQRGGAPIFIYCHRKEYALSAPYNIKLPLLTDLSTHSGINVIFSSDLSYSTHALPDTFQFVITEHTSPTDLFSTVEVSSFSSFQLKSSLSPFVQAILDRKNIALIGLETNPECQMALHAFLNYPFVYGHLIPIEELSLTLYVSSFPTSELFPFSNYPIAHLSPSSQDYSLLFHSLFPSFPPDLCDSYLNGFSVFDTFRCEGVDRPSLTSTFIRQLASQIQSECDQDRALAASVFHVRKAFLSLFAKRYRSHPDIYRSIKSQFYSLFSDSRSVFYQKGFFSFPSISLESPFFDSFLDLLNASVSLQSHTAPLSKTGLSASITDLLQEVSLSLEDGSFPFLSEILSASPLSLTQISILNSFFNSLFSKYFPSFSDSLSEEFSLLSNPLLTDPSHGFSSKMRLTTLSRRLKRLEYKLLSHGIVFLKGEPGCGKSYFGELMAEKYCQSDSETLYFSITLSPDTTESDLYFTHTLLDDSTRILPGPITLWEAASPSEGQLSILQLDEATFSKPGLYKRLLHTLHHSSGLKKVIVTANPDHFPGRHHDSDLELGSVLYLSKSLSSEFIVKTFIEPRLLKYFSLDQVSFISKTYLELFSLASSDTDSLQFFTRDHLDLIGLFLFFISKETTHSQVLFTQALYFAFYFVFKHTHSKNFIESLSSSIDFNDRPFNAEFHAFLSQLSSHYKDSDFDFNNEDVALLLYDLWIRAKVLEDPDCFSLCKKGVHLSGVAGRGKDCLLRYFLSYQYFLRSSLSSPLSPASSTLFFSKPIFYTVKQNASHEEICSIFTTAQMSRAPLVLSEANLLPSAFLESLVNRPLQSPIYFTTNPTSFSGRYTLSDALHSRFSSFLIKPYSFSSLFSILSSLTHGDTPLCHFVISVHLYFQQASFDKNLPILPTINDLFYFISLLESKTQKDAILDTYQLFFDALDESYESVLSHIPTTDPIPLLPKLPLVSSSISLASSTSSESSSHTFPSNVSVSSYRLSSQPTSLSPFSIHKLRLFLTLSKRKESDILDFLLSCELPLQPKIMSSLKDALEFSSMLPRHALSPYKHSHKLLFFLLGSKNSEKSRLNYYKIFLEKINHDYFFKTLLMNFSPQIQSHILFRLHTLLHAYASSEFEFLELESQTVGSSAVLDLPKELRHQHHLLKQPSLVYNSDLATLPQSIHLQPALFPASRDSIIFERYYPQVLVVHSGKIQLQTFIHPRLEPISPLSSLPAQCSGPRLQSSLLVPNPESLLFLPSSNALDTLSYFSSQDYPYLLFRCPISSVFLVQFPSLPSYPLSFPVQGQYDSPLQRYTLSQFRLRNIPYRLSPFPVELALPPELASALHTLLNAPSLDPISSSALSTLQSIVSCHDPIEQLLQLQRYCSGFSYKKETLLSLPHLPPMFQSFFSLFLTQNGSCNHRSTYFYMMSAYLHLPVIKICSSVHAFVEVMFESPRTYVQIDLGGTEVPTTLSLETTSSPPLLPLSSLEYHSFDSLLLSLEYFQKKGLPLSSHFIHSFFSAVSESSFAEWDAVKHSPLFVSFIENFCQNSFQVFSYTLSDIQFDFFITLMENDHSNSLFSSLTFTQYTFLLNRLYEKGATTPRFKVLFEKKFPQYTLYECPRHSLKLSSKNISPPSVTTPLFPLTLRGKPIRETLSMSDSDTRFQRIPNQNSPNLSRFLNLKPAFPVFSSTRGRSKTLLLSGIHSLGLPIPLLHILFTELSGNIAVMGPNGIQFFDSSKKLCDYYSDYLSCYSTLSIHKEYPLIDPNQFFILTDFDRRQLLSDFLFRTCTFIESTSTAFGSNNLNIYLNLDYSLLYSIDIDFSNEKDILPSLCFLLLKQERYSDFEQLLSYLERKKTFFPIFTDYILFNSICDLLPHIPELTLILFLQYFSSCDGFTLNFIFLHYISKQEFYLPKLLLETVFTGCPPDQYPLFAFKNLINEVKDIPLVEEGHDFFFVYSELSSGYCPLDSFNMLFYSTLPNLYDPTESPHFYYPFLFLLPFSDSFFFSLFSSEDSGNQGNSIYENYLLPLFYFFQIKNSTIETEFKKALNLFHSNLSRIYPSDSYTYCEIFLLCFDTLSNENFLTLFDLPFFQESQLLKPLLCLLYHLKLPENSFDFTSELSTFVSSGECFTHLSYFDFLLPTFVSLFPEASITFSHPPKFKFNSPRNLSFYLEHYPKILFDFFTSSNYALALNSFEYLSLLPDRFLNTEIRDGFFESENWVGLLYCLLQAPHLFNSDFRDKLSHVTFLDNDIHPIFKDMIQRLVYYPI